jgi:methyl-accepting chemotaxis protein
MDREWQQMIEKLVESNAKAIEALGNQAAEDRSLIRQVGESAQQVAGAVARLVDIIQVDRERLARQENISQSLLERLNRIDP